MLILSRRKDDKIIIDDVIEISIIEIKGDQIKIGINAPTHVKIYRHEVFEAIKKENTAATSSSLPFDNSSLDIIKKLKKE